MCGFLPCFFVFSLIFHTVSDKKLTFFVDCTLYHNWQEKSSEIVNFFHCKRSLSTFYWTRNWTIPVNCVAFYRASLHFPWFFLQFPIRSSAFLQKWLLHWIKNPVNFHCKRSLSNFSRARNWTVLVNCLAFYLASLYFPWFSIQFPIRNSAFLLIAHCVIIDKKSRVK